MTRSPFRRAKKEAKQWLFLVAICSVIALLSGTAMGWIFQKLGL